MLAHMMQVHDVSQFLLHAEKWEGLGHVVSCWRKVVREGIKVMHRIDVLCLCILHMHIARN